jgi:hypothetical protein
MAKVSVTAAATNDCPQLVHLALDQYKVVVPATFSCW